MILTASSFFPEKLNSLLNHFNGSSLQLTLVVSLLRINHGKQLIPKTIKKGGWLPWSAIGKKFWEIHFPQPPLLPRGTRAFRRSRWKGWRGCVWPLLGKQRWKCESKSLKNGSWKWPHTIHGTGIFTYIFVDDYGLMIMVFMVYVGKYIIHGWYGWWFPTGISFSNWFSDSLVPC